MSATDEVSASVPLVDIPPEIAESLLSAGAPATMLQAPIYRALAHQPDILKGWIGLSWGMRSKPVISPRVRELMIVRLAILQGEGAAFVRHHHEGYLRDAGASDAEVGALVDWADSPEFSDAERAALALADGVHAGLVPDTALAELARHFEPDARVELIMTCGMYELVPRLNNALRVG